MTANSVSSYTSKGMRILTTHWPSLLRGRTPRYDWGRESKGAASLITWSTHWEEFNSIVGAHWVIMGSSTVHHTPHHTIPRHTNNPTVVTRHVGRSSHFNLVELNFCTQTFCSVTESIFPRCIITISEQEVKTLIFFPIPIFTSQIFIPYFSYKKLSPFTV